MKYCPSCGSRREISRHVDKYDPDTGAEHYKLIEICPGPYCFSRLPVCVGEGVEERVSLAERITKVLRKVIDDAKRSSGGRPSNGHD